MIISKLCGGLGNQMFQYAVARTLADNFARPLFLDISYFDHQANDTPRQYSLDVFNIRAEIASLDMIKSVKSGFWNSFLNFNKSKIVKESKTNQYHEISLISSSQNYYLDGYWQTEKYFLVNRQKLLNDFCLKQSLSAVANNLANHAKSVCSVSIHVRRGDYLNYSNTFNIQSVDYYQRAINVLKNKLVSPIFFVFSDDITWCKANLSFANDLIFIDESIADYEQLTLMSLCSHHIIANSSFSWWGAWLGLNQDKVVIAPQNWFADHALTVNDIVPNDWLKL